MKKRQYHLFYKRVKVGNQTESLFFELDNGLSYLLRRFILIQPDYGVFAGPLTVGYPGVGVELETNTGAKRWQLDPVPAELYSAPRKDRVTVKTETAPVDLNGYGVNMSAVFKPRAVTLNLFYDVGEIIYVKITGQEYITPPGAWGPDYIDIALDGEYLP
jgi:hypothetical protein